MHRGRTIRYYQAGTTGNGIFYKIFKNLLKNAFSTITSVMYFLFSYRKPGRSPGPMGRKKRQPCRHPEEEAAQDQL